ncbi:MAG: hypothetical protein QOK17_1571 [Sphingomonadales bacterium]|jgi:hypothetical protein|nr:hypothetical protein [Sphingomonadales bacterium]
MVGRRLLAALAAIGLCVPTSGSAQFGGGGDDIGTLPIHAIGPNRGGVVGLAVDTNPYNCGTAMCLKVIGLNGTNFTGIHIGDYIVQVNKVFFHSVNDFFGLVRENPPGTRVRIDYWDAANNLQPMYQLADLVGASNSNYASIDSALPQLETLLSTDARHWRISRYHPLTLRNLRILSVSSDGRSYTIEGTYNYGGFWSGNYEDWVDFRYSDNQFACIEYGQERGCRPLLREDRSVLGPVLAGIGAIAVIAIASNSRGSSTSRGSSGYDGETRFQCNQRCNRYGDPNPNAEAAIIAECRAGCSRLPD